MHNERLLWWKHTCLFYWCSFCTCGIVNAELILLFFEPSNFFVHYFYMYIYLFIEYRETLDETLCWFVPLSYSSLHFPVCGDVHRWWRLWEIQMLEQCLYFSVNQRFEIIVKRACKLYSYNVLWSVFFFVLFA